MSDPATQYPGSDRQGIGYSIRLIKALLDSDAIRDHGSDAVLLAIFIAGREDKLHYQKPPRFWRAELMERFGKGSPNAYLRMVGAAESAGLIHHRPGTKTTPGEFWTLVPDWLEIPQPDALRKRNGTDAKRSENGTESGTRSENGTENGALNGTECGTEYGAHSIPITRNPSPSKKAAPAAGVSRVRSGALNAALDAVLEDGVPV